LTLTLSGALSLGTNSFQKALEAGQANFGIIDYEQSRELFLSVIGFSFQMSGIKPLMG
jgi:hypothetical protein